MIISLTNDGRAYDNLGVKLNLRSVNKLIQVLHENPQLGEITTLPPETSLSGNGCVTLIECTRSLWDELDHEQFFDEIIDEVSNGTISQ